MKCFAVFVIALACLSSGCSWVKVSEQGSSVAVANLANVRDCKKLSTVTVRVKDNFVGSMKRDPNKVAQELTNLARNEAAAEGGNTIVPVSQVADGRQSFDVYNCY
ncbi:DUF4156 domain-containing protein [Cellvibrio japonicus]|uniref:Putative lipoprotein n=1 Tax=Cellvibrio japonicus (strain Ueda107) TaxID=498211 RepID=B3PGW6_CELJU|nr:DUF4156 domain-containing protein [Cellvibrio japonicus]ACE85088.1 putative lipoprotein [Cellvibrio japonicus Ueda107]QEI13772.1 DUF4156 domain-containing protein [Cellvibrio japonicus]QEI17346.1 DUF4156 domain-containing protein [Cellvibrio japonicus]QEI20922.1 DUF4156 domain-containing protein [Cellvibrio japonicus]